MSPQTLSEKIWEQHLVRREAGQPDLLYVDLHLVHEVTSPQAFESLRMTGRTVRRPDLTMSTVDHNIPTIDRDLPNPDPLSQQQIETLRENCKRVRHPAVRHVRRPPGHRARHRAGAGADPAGHDHRLRRQPHLDARRVRRARVRHRHVRGRARARDADAAAGAAEDDVDRGHRPARPGRHGEGRHPRHHPQDRRRRRRRPRHRVPRRRHPQPLDGGADDDLQHVDRGRARAPASSRRTRRRSPT